MRITKKAVSIVLAIMMVATMMSVMAVSANAFGIGFGGGDDPALDPGDHNWDYANPVWDTNPTDEFFEYYAYVTFNCNDCDETKKLKAKGGMVLEHTADCQEGGYEYVTCSVDFAGQHFSHNYVLQELSEPDLEYHVFTEHVPATPATYNAPGNSEYWRCAGCGKYFSDESCENEIEENSWVIPTLTGAEAEVNGVKYGTLQEALDAAPSGSTVTLLDDIDGSAVSYSSDSRFAYFIKNKANLTLDGDGHTVAVRGRGFGVSGSNAEITFKDITINNAKSGGRAIDTRGGGISSLTLDNAVLNATGSNFAQALTIGGNQSKVMDLNIINGSEIHAPIYYAIVTFNPVNATIDGSTLDGWACIYAKGINSSAGSDGSVFNVTNSTLLSSNIAPAGNSNSFSMVKIENSSNVEVNISNCNLTVTSNNTNKQYLFNAEEFTDEANGTYPYPTLTNDVNMGEGNTVEFVGEKAEFAKVASGCEMDVDISGGTFNKEVPVKYCAEDFYPVSDGSGGYTVDKVENAGKQIIVDGDPFGIENQTINPGAILGVQMKTNVADAGMTSQSGQENGNDLRFIVAVDTELLKAAEDYGFVLAKVDKKTSTNADRTSINTKFYNMKYNGTNGEKTLSAKDTSNNIAGIGYGTLEADTPYKFVTCAVNSIENNKKIAARFYVKVNGKVSYFTYTVTTDYSGSYRCGGCVAGIDLYGNVY